MKKSTNNKTILSFLSLLAAVTVLFSGITLLPGCTSTENESLYSTTGDSLSKNSVTLEGLTLPEGTDNSHTVSATDTSGNAVSSSSTGSLSNESNDLPSSDGTVSSAQTAQKVPAYSGNPYAVINNNTPVFSSSELKTTGYEKYSNLDYLGRVGVALASLGKETMPKEGEKRGSISSIYPTGWKQAKYDNISGKYLYNRCHLIGWQLSAENANKQNLLTGTKYFNVSGMLPFENMVADYIKETENHVAYRVTPVFKGDNLLASGVQIEAYSVEDDGEGICFNVYCYNVQPGIKIDYSNGASSLDSSAQNTKATTTKSAATTKSNAKPSATKQNTTKASTTKPSTTKPSTTKASTTKPSTTKPGTTKAPQTTAKNQNPQTTSAQNNNSQTVYITATGSKYHSRKNCSGLSNANEIYEATLESAQKQGLGPCKKCH